MKVSEVKGMDKKSRRWCWWLSRYLLFQDILPNGDYRFVDFGDKEVIIPAHKAIDLPERPY